MEAYTVIVGVLVGGLACAAGLTRYAPPHADWEAPNVSTSLGVRGQAESGPARLHGCCGLLEGGRVGVLLGTSEGIRRFQASCG